MQASSKAMANCLCRDGILQLDGIFSDERIKGWNERLDGPFAQAADEPRAYVDSSQLYDLGILQEVMAPSFRNMIANLIPDAVFYHFHAFEIAGGQSLPHVGSKGLAGWHRDRDTLPAYQPETVNQICFFVYLTDVNLDSGPFEFLPRAPRLPFQDDVETVQIFGRAGTTFAWNRAFFHRACPNSSQLRRRVLKISIQSSSLPNSRIGLDEFRQVAKQVDGRDDFLEFMLGKYHGSHHLQMVRLTANDDTSEVTWHGCEPNSIVHVGGLRIARHKLKTAWRSSVRSARQILRRA